MLAYAVTELAKVVEANIKKVKRLPILNSA
jgi:hypothetical protein